MKPARLLVIPVDFRASHGVPIMSPWVSHEAPWDFHGAVSWRSRLYLRRLTMPASRPATWWLTTFHRLATWTCAFPLPQTTSCSSRVARPLSHVAQSNALIALSLTSGCSHTTARTSTRAPTARSLVLNFRTDGDLRQQATSSRWFSLASYSCCKTRQCCCRLFS